MWRNISRLTLFNISRLTLFNISRLTLFNISRLALFVINQTTTSICSRFFNLALVTGSFLTVWHSSYASRGADDTLAVQVQYTRSYTSPESSIFSRSWPSLPRVLRWRLAEIWALPSPPPPHVLCTCTLGIGVSTFTGFEEPATRGMFTTDFHLLVECTLHQCCSSCSEVWSFLLSCGVVFHYACAALGTFIWHS